MWYIVLVLGRCWFRATYLIGFALVMGVLVHCQTCFKVPSYHEVANLILKHMQRVLPHDEVHIEGFKSHNIIQIHNNAMLCGTD